MRRGPADVPTKTLEFFKVRDHLGKASGKGPTARTIGILGYPEVQALDLIGPADAFAIADEHVRAAGLSRKPDKCRGPRFHSYDNGVNQDRNRLPTSKATTVSTPSRPNLSTSHCQSTAARS